MARALREQGSVFTLLVPLPTRASALTLDPGSVSTLIEFHGFGLLHGQLQRDESCWLLFLARISR